VLKSILRTTNSLEIWNRNIKNVVRIPHPNKSDNISSKEQVIFEKMLIDNDFMEYRSKIDDREERLLRIYMEYDKNAGLLYLKSIVFIYKWKFESSEEK
jgi:hypothetical protein